MLVMYRLPRWRWAAVAGAQVRLPGDRSARVDTLGQVPPGWTTYPARAVWRAGLRIPQYGNYTFSAARTRGTLEIDGVGVIRGGRPRRVTVALAAGMHAVRLGATVTRPSYESVRWSGVAEASGTALRLRPIEPYELYAPGADAVRGLFGGVSVTGEPDQHRIDGTLANCCLYDELGALGRSVTARWSGVLRAPVGGVYAMSLFSQGPLELRLDGRVVLRSTTDADSLAEARVRLARGAHRVEAVYRINRAPGGVEWTWTPPGGRTSIVPPSALRPLGGGPERRLRSGPVGPGYAPLVTIP